MELSKLKAKTGTKSLKEIIKMQKEKNLIKDYLLEDDSTYNFLWSSHRNLNKALATLPTEEKTIETF